MPTNDRTMDSEFDRLRNEMANSRMSGTADGFVTVTELTKKLDCCANSVRRLLRAGIDAGTIEHGTVPIRKINGVIIKSDAYRTVDKPASKKKCRT